MLFVKHQDKIHRLIQLYSIVVIPQISGSPDWKWLNRLLRDLSQKGWPCRLLLYDHIKPYERELLRMDTPDDPEILFAKYELGNLDLRDWAERLASSLRMVFQDSKVRSVRNW